MKKILFLLAVAVLMFSSCQNKEAYTVEGTYADSTLNGKTIYLQVIDSIQALTPTVLDSVVLKNNKFTFSGKTNGDTVMAFVSVGILQNRNIESPVGSIVLEPGKISITLEKNGDVTLGGTPNNDSYNKILDVMNKIAALYQEVSEAGGIEAIPMNAEGLDPNARLAKMQDDLKNNSFEFAKANMSNKAGQFAFFSYIDAFDKDQIKELIATADEKFRSNGDIKMLEEQVNHEVPAVGKPYADARLINTEGAPVALSEYAGQGNYVLLNFWISQSTLCMEEMPTMRKLYNSYKDKGLVIIGISEDDNKTSWADGIKQMNMSWIQLADDQTQAAIAYGVQEIPYNVLIDPKGTIVALNIKGAELERKIAELIK